jgi:hypothetical protein
MAKKKPAKKKPAKKKPVKSFKGKPFAWLGAKQTLEQREANRKKRLKKAMGQK